jgi:uncharacterized membrane protein
MNERLSPVDYLTFAIFALQAAFALHVGINGPTEATLPMHWNGNWQVDRWGTGREFAVFFGGITLVGLVISGGMGLGAMRADAANDLARGRSLRIGQGIVLFTFAVLGLMIAWLTVGGLPPEEAANWSMGALSLIFLGMGAFLGRVAPNPFIGIRTPWAYKSRRAWDRANRLAGRLFFLAGLAGLIAAPLVAQPMGTFLLVGAAVAIIAWSGFESWRVWRSDPDRQPF